MTALPEGPARRPTGIRSSSIAGVVLAAGTSARFDGNKLLAPIDGEPAIARVIAAALASRLGKIVIVLGYQSELVQAAVGAGLENDRVDLVCIDDYAKGQSRSVIAGLDALDGKTTAAMYLMGDQPLVTPQIIDVLISSFENAPGDICYPTVHGKRRNPVIFASAFFSDIRGLDGDTGARAIIEDNREKGFAVPFTDERPFRDMDTTAAYRELIETWSE